MSSYGSADRVNGPRSPEASTRTAASGSAGGAATGAVSGAGRGSSAATTTAARPATTTAPRPAASGEPRGQRKARLRLSRLDPWSVMKLSFLLSIAIGIILVVAVAALWLVLDSLGVWSSVGQTIQQVTGAGAGGTTGFDLQTTVSLSRVVGFTTLLAVVDVVVVTAVATLAAFLYNLACSFAGGLEVTLTDPD